MKDVISIGEYLSDYSFAEILIFIIIFMLAIKEGISLFDWAKARFRKASKKAYEEKREHDKIEEEIEQIKSIKDQIEPLNMTILWNALKSDMLFTSENMETLLCWVL